VTRYRASYGQPVQSGGTDVTYAGATQQQSQAVAFPVEFGAIPRVVVTSVDSRFVCGVSGISTAGFTVTLYYIPGTVLAGYVQPVLWIAHSLA
jgi:hypothetical protein